MLLQVIPNSKETLHIRYNGEIRRRHLLPTPDTYNRHQQSNKNVKESYYNPYFSKPYKRNTQTYGRNDTRQHPSAYSKSMKSSTTNRNTNFNNTEISKNTGQLNNR